MAETANIKSSVGTVKTEQRYLSDRIDVQGARRKLLEANKKLTLAQNFFKNVSATNKSYQAYADEVKAAQAAADTAKVELDRIEALAKADYQKSFAGVKKKKTEAEAAKVDDQIESARLVLQRLKDSGQSTAQQDAIIKDLLDKKNKTGKYAPKVETGAVVGDQDAGKKPTIDYAALINAAGRYVNDLKPADRKELAKNLQKANFYKGPIVDIYTDELVIAYQQALVANQARSLNLGKDISWGEFLQSKINETTALGRGGITTTTDTDVDITRKTIGQVEQDIEEIAVKVLGRSISEEDKAESWYDNLVKSINKMYEKGTKTVTTSTSRGGDGRIVSGSKRIVTPSVAEADIDALIERRLRKNDPESVGRKERLDFVSWMNKALGD